MKRKIEEAIALRESTDYKDSIDRWKELIQAEPANAFLHYQCAWTHDAMGNESGAVPYYEEAIRLGLDDTDLQGAYLGLGSTYRTLGEYEKSREVFEKGLEHFPENTAMKVFYSMTLYNLSEHRKGMQLLLECIAETSQDPGIEPYKKAISFYSGRLDTVWE
ncbi:tetratricopeptide repeat protein [Bacillus sp. RO3]|nr:tetratricopeptide repeat protein [Bacillus sp. RO3]